MMPASPKPTPTPSRQERLKQRMTALYEEYGPVAIGVYLVLWVGTLGALWMAVKMGWKPESAAGEAGTFGAAYVAFRFTLPPRIGATVVLTPLVAKVLERLKLRRPRA